MYKIVSNLSARPELTREQFLDLWQNRHRDIILKLPNLKGYRQSPAIEHKTEWPASGLAELWFESLNDIRLAFASPEADLMRLDEEDLFSSISWYIVEEGPMLRASTAQ